MAAYVGTTGNDTYTGGVDDDTIDGALGNDTLNGGGGNDQIYGDDGNDSLLGGEGNDAIYGEAGHDALRGNQGNDTLEGGEGSDTLNGGDGDDTLDGGTITDTFNYNDLNVATYVGMGSPGSGVSVNLQTGLASDGSGGTDTLLNIMSVVGSDYDDYILGTTDWGFEIFDGGLGNDTIDGGELSATTSNRVTYFSASGAVQVDLADGSATGAAGDDTLININHVQGSKFGDTLIGSDSEFTETFMGRAGNDTIDGAGGLDIARYDFQVNANLGTHTAIDGEKTNPSDLAFGTDTLANIEGLRGSSFNDTLTGGDVGNEGEGKFEFFNGMGGDDLIDGGSGWDRADYGNANFGVQVDLQAGTAQDGMGGTDTLLNIEGVRGGRWNDSIEGNAEGNRLEGAAGDDRISGRDGDDTLIGDDGNDTLAGGRGNDVYAYGSSSAGDFERIDDLETGDSLYFSSLEFSTLFQDAGDEELGIGAASISTSGGNSVLTVRFAEGESGLVRIALPAPYTAENFSFADYDGAGTQLFFELLATEGDDTLQAFESDSVIDGLGGNDFIFAGNGDDTILGGDGDDYIGAGGSWQGGTDSIDGGDGYDVASYNFNGSATAVTFTSTAAGGTQLDPLDGTTDILLNIEEVHVFGSNAGDRLTGDSLRNFIQGNGGNDTLAGGGGHDVFAWDAGQVAGNDTISDLGAEDSLHFRGMNITHVLAGSDASELQFGQLMVGTPSAGATRLYARVGEGAEGLATITLQGSFDAGSFRIDNDDSGNGTLTVFDLTTGSNDIWGGNGYETINALAGDDWITGNGGDDTLTGGGGHDTFGYDAWAGDEGQDTITDLRDLDQIFFKHVILQTTVLESGDPAELQQGQVLLQGVEEDGTITRMTLRVGDGEDGLRTIDLKGTFTATSFVIDSYEDGEDFGSFIRMTGTDTSEVVYGAWGNDALLGGAGNDTLIGADGNDTLDGGAGSDVLRGGAGNDTYVFNSAGDNIDGESSASAGGIDTVLASVDYSAVSDYVEKLTAVAGTAAIDLTGNQLANTLTGNDGNNILNGMAGADLMAGGKGNDTYYIDNTSDNIDGESSASSGGIDTVITSIDWSAAKDYVENLTAATGTAAIDLTGNQLANILTGNSGVNILNGGAGADVMRGGAGSDVYYVDNVKDDIDGESSASSGGIDTVISSVSFSIASDYVEQLSLTGSSSISGTGNKLANVITGNTGKNTLDGGAGNDTIVGGAGADKLIGGAGADRFVYAATSESTLSAYDMIMDFVRGSDKLDFSKLDGNAGRSGQQDFTFIGTAAFSGNATGQLRYTVSSGDVILYGSTDADATAEFAVRLDNLTTLSASDFVF